MRQLGRNWKSIGKILLVMYVVTAVLLLLLAMLVQRLGWEQRGISAGICAVYAVSCAAGGILTGKVQKYKKFLWGFFVGLVYALTVLVITLFVKHGVGGDLSVIVWNFVLCLLSGMLGGMVS